MTKELHIGIDDTDSEKGGCTTYTAAILFEELCKKGIRPLDYPWLVRLNPNIPWKTRGNGALSIHLLVKEAQIESVKLTALEITEQTSQLSAKRADPAVVFLTGPVPPLLLEYSRSALHDVLTVGDARSIAAEASVEVHVLKGRRGIIGSLAAIGAGLDTCEHTFEIIAYRTKENLGTKRRVDIESIRKMNFEQGPRTFHNLDPESGRILICPHGPDPVLLGIRGLTALDVQNALGQVQVNEPIERTVIFKTNQGTDAHLTRDLTISQLEPYQSGVVEGRVETMPLVLRGGHVVFELDDGTGRIDCAAYAPTRSLSTISRELLPGDRIRAYGGVRQRHDGRITLNLEKIDVLSVSEKLELRNPPCTLCGTRCESMGVGQEFRCKKCGHHESRSSATRTVSKRRVVETTYVAAVGARRHLTRPTHYN